MANTNTKANKQRRKMPMQMQMHFQRISKHIKIQQQYQSQRSALKKYLKMHKNKIFIEEMKDGAS